MSILNGQPVGNFNFLDTLSVDNISELETLDTSTYSDGQRVLVNTRQEGANGGWWAFTISLTGDFDTNDLVYPTNGIGAFYPIQDAPLGITIAPDGTIQTFNGGGASAGVNNITLTSAGNTVAITPTGEQEGNVTFNLETIGSGSGTVTSVGMSSSTLTIAGTNPVTTSGSFAVNLPASGVTAGAYTNSNITVDAEGRIIAASDGTGSGTVTTVNSGTGLTGGPITTTGTLSILPTGVTAGSYTSANITVNSEGQILTASDGSGGGSGTVTSVSLTSTDGSLVTTGSPVTTTGSIDVQTTAYKNTAVSGTTYTVSAADNHSVLQIVNGGDTTVTIPASAGFIAFQIYVYAGTCTLTAGSGILEIIGKSSFNVIGDTCECSLYVYPSGSDPNYVQVLIGSASSSGGGSGTVTSVSLTSTDGSLVTTGSPVTTTGSIDVQTTAYKNNSIAGTTYTVSAADNHSVLQMISGGTTTITIPAAAGFISFQVYIGFGTCTLVAGSGILDIIGQSSFVAGDTFECSLYLVGSGSSPNFVQVLSGAASSSGSGTVTSVGLSSSTLSLTGTNPVTGSGTIGVDLPSTPVIPGSYTNSNITIDAQGRITAAADGGGGGSGTVTTVDTGTGLTGGPITTTGTLSIADTTVTPGSYTNANLTVNAQGQITAASDGSGGGSGTVTSVSLTSTDGSLVTTGSPVTTTGSIDVQTTAYKINVISGTSYTVQASDNHTVLQIINASPVTITIPASAGFIAFQIYVFSYAAGCTIVTGSGIVDIDEKTTVAPNESVECSLFSSTSGSSPNYVQVIPGAISGSGSGTVTSVGLSSSTLTLSGTNPITGSGTIGVDLPSTTVIPGSYTNANITVDAEGRLTSAADGSGSGSGTVTSVDAGTGLTGGPITSSGTLSIANTTVTAGAYTSADITINAQGQITAAADGSGGVPTFTGVAYNTAGTLTAATVDQMQLNSSINPIISSWGGGSGDLVLSTGSATTYFVGWSSSGNRILMPASPLQSFYHLIFDNTLGSNGGAIYESDGSTPINDESGSPAFIGPGVDCYVQYNIFTTMWGAYPSFVVTYSPVTPGSYTSANITVNSNGQITAAADGGGIPTFTGVAYNTAGTLSDATFAQMFTALGINPGPNVIIQNTNLVLTGTSSQVFGACLYGTTPTISLPPFYDLNSHQAYFLITNVGTIPIGGGGSFVGNTISILDFMGNTINDVYGNPLTVREGQTILVMYPLSGADTTGYYISSSYGTLSLAYEDSASGAAFPTQNFTAPYSLVGKILTVYLAALNTGSYGTDAYVAISGMPSEFVPTGFIQSSILVAYQGNAPGPNPITWDGGNFRINPTYYFGFLVGNEFPASTDPLIIQPNTLSWAIP